MKLIFVPSFVKQLRKLEPALQNEVIEKLNLLQDSKNHMTLKVHKLNGKLKARWSFSVNYKYRVLFHKLSEDTILILSVGSHSVYDN